MDCVELKDFIYLDNNATTQMPAEVIKEMVSWCNRGNPSAGYPSAEIARKMMAGFRRELGIYCGVETCCEEDRDLDEELKKTAKKLRGNPALYKVIFTSGASEANCFVVRGAVEAYRTAAAKTGSAAIPHVVFSAIEHKSIINCVEILQKSGLCTSTEVKPVDCVIRPQDIGAAIRGNTCIVCVMSTNNETGVQMDVKNIAKICHAAGVPFHCDTVQSFGKYAADLSAEDLSPDSLAISFHKFGGPPGVGAAMIKQKFLAGWGLSPLVAGTQNEGLRGGTENLPGLGAARLACEINFKNRGEKNRRLGELKMIFWRRISAEFPTIFLQDYLAKGIKSIRGRTVVLIAPKSGSVSASTLMISVVDPVAQPCNAKMKKWMLDNGVVIAVGSACNTASAKASHVLYALDADRNIRKGALRISFGDNNTSAEVEKAAEIFVRMLK